MRAIWLFAFLAFTGLVSLAAPLTQTIHLKEYLGHRWSDELISYPLDAGLQAAHGVAATDETGARIPCQAAGGRIYLLVTLPADTEKTFTITGARSTVAVGQPVTVKQEHDALLLDSDAMAVRLPSGTVKYPHPMEAKSVPGPLQGVRAKDSVWVGASWLDAPLKVTGYTTTVSAAGPLFADATVEYTFEGGKHYRFSVHAIAGQPTMTIDETMDLNPGGKYALLKYDNDADASTWEWWSLADSTHLGVNMPDYPRANAVFSFYPGLQPNQSRWVGGRVSQPKYGLDASGQPLMDVESGQAFAPISYAEDDRVNRIAGWWLNSFSNYAHSYTLYNDQNPKTPLISLSTGRASRNVNPNLNPPPEPWIKIITGFNDLGIFTRKSKDLQVIGAICLGSREWLLSAEPQSALPPKDAKGMPYPYRAYQKYGRFPLDKIKDWSFEWPEPKNAWPRLFCKPGDLAEMRARVAAATGGAAKDPAIPAIYRAGGTPQAMAKQTLEQLKAYVDGPLNGNGHGGVNWFHASLHMISLMPLWEAAMATPELDPAVRAKIKAYGAFIAQRCWDDDYWPPKETANGWGSANMGTLASTARVLTAGAMAGMPGNAARLQRCRGYLDGNLGPLLAADGSAVSCPHYIEASIQPILYMALALKYGGDYDAFKDDPKLTKFGQFMMDILTPPDPRSPVIGSSQGLPMGQYSLTAHNRRNLWPLGNTSRTETSTMMDLLTLGFAGVDDRLTGMLHTAGDEMGHAAGGFIAPALLSSPTAKPIAPEFSSRWYPSYCAILRDGQPHESWFAIRYSKFAFDHFESDQGSFSWFAKGVPLMMHFGNMYSPDAGQAVYHSRIAWEVQEGPQRPCPGYGTDGCFYKDYSYFEHKYEPWTDKVEAPGKGEGYAGLGEVRAFSTLPTADYLQGQVPVKAMMIEPYFPDTPVSLKPDPNQKRDVRSVASPFTWQRRVLFAKAQQESDPQYLLIRDDFPGESPCPPATDCFWIMASALKFAGNQAHATGQFGVDLELYAAQPAQPRFSQWEWSHKNWGGEKQLCLRITQSDGKPFLNLLYPRRPDEPLPTFATIADGNGVKITQPNGTVDYAFLAPKEVTFTDGTISFTGTAGYLRQRKDRLQIVLSAAGTVTVKGLTFTTHNAASLHSEGDQVTIQTDGDAQGTTLKGKMQ